MAKINSGGRRRAPLAAGLLLLSVAAAFLVAYRVIDSDVEADGRLHEPFALIPLAWLSGLAGAVLVAVNFWRVRAKR